MAQTLAAHLRDPDSEPEAHIEEETRARPPDPSADGSEEITYEPDGPVVVLGTTGIAAYCHVVAGRPERGMVELVVELHGGPLGNARIEECWVGRGDSLEHAVIRGVRDWAQGSMQALLDAFSPEAGAMAGSAASSGQELRLDGRRYLLYASPLWLRGKSAEALADALGPESLSARLAAAEVLPVLDTRWPTLVSILATQGPSGQTIEVKINGRDWPSTHSILEELPWPDSDEYIAVRELAVFVPVAPADDEILALPAHALRRTWAGLAAADPGGELFGGQSHRYQLAPPLTDEALAHIEALAGPLPEDFRHFVQTVGKSGAGPYHGLLPADAPAQLEILAQPYPQDQESISGETEPLFMLGLAHMGCGYMSLLVVSGAARGEVWADLTPMGGGLRKTHDSFTEWYLAWLGNLVGNRPPEPPFAAGACALVGVLSQALSAEEARRGMEPGTIDPEEAVRAIPDRGIAAHAHDSLYFEDGEPIEICPHCARLIHDIGLRPEQLAPGLPPTPLRAQSPATPDLDDDDDDHDDDGGAEQYDDDREGEPDLAGRTREHAWRAGSLEAGETGAAHVPSTGKAARTGEPAAPVSAAEDNEATAKHTPAMSKKSPWWRRILGLD